jgi:hypothetical protein
MSPGKVLLDYLKSLSKTTDYVDIVVEKKEAYPYNPEFVSEIVKSREGEGITINREDLWK